MNCHITLVVKVLELPPVYPQFCYNVNSNAPECLHGTRGVESKATEDIMPRVRDLKGQRFGRLLVLEFACKRKNGGFMWECLCDCGAKKIVASSHLIDKRVVSCGCYKNELIVRRSTSHGKAHSRVYKIYHDMKDRCYKPTKTHYGYYGGRGIRVCDRWLESFENFYADMGEPPTDKHTIERIDVNGNYCPENCCWATYGQQARNKTNNRLMTLNGKTQPLIDWTDAFNVDYRTVRDRLSRGWDLKRALTEPVQKTYPEMMIDFEGETLSVTEWSKRLGIKYQTLKTRLRKGMTIKEAFEIPVQESKRLLKFRGETKTMTEWSKELGISYTTIASRLNQLGWSVEDALSKK